MIDVLAIYRAERFSPNSADKDKAILDSVCLHLDVNTYNIEYMNETGLVGDEQADIILSMGREVPTLDFLAAAEAKGSVVINPAQGVRHCARTVVDSIMRANSLPAAPQEGSCGYWVKRGDEAAQSPADVVFAANETEKQAVLAAFSNRGVTSVVTSAHVQGDLVKFYGVSGTDFFAIFYPADDGCFKFDDELRNGQPAHYKFSETALRADVSRLAELTGVLVYGGDCIVRPDGTYVIIDFNDWPSFSRCREQAAEAIAAVVRKAVIRN